MSTLYSSGKVTAYGAALDGGYTGTYAQFSDKMAELPGVVSVLSGITTSVTTLNPGSSATASFNNTTGVLSLGIPSGYDGDTDIVAKAYSPSATYEVGEYVIYSGDLYICIVKITTPEAWNVLHWKLADLGSGLFRLKKQITEATKNLWEPIFGTINGITCEATENGGIHVYGTATNNARFQGSVSVTGPFVLTCSRQNTGGTSAIYVQLRDSNATVISSAQIGTTTTGSYKKTVTDTSITAAVTDISVSSGDTVDCILYVQLEAGASSTPYMPYLTSVDYYLRQNSMKVYGSDAITSDDLNNAPVGLSFLSSSTVYSNSPYNSAVSGYVLTTSPRGIDFRIQYIIRQNASVFEIHTRRKAGSPATWENWKKLYNSLDYELATNGNTVSESFSAVSVASQGENKGDRIKVMSYNVANFNNDTATYIPDDKLFNLKRMLYHANADIVCCQEDRGYIDSGNSKESTKYVFYPTYPYKYGDGGVTIHSHKQGVSGNLLKYTTGRTLRYMTYSIGTKTLLMVSTHPGLTETNRAQEYSELFSWLNGVISLATYSGDLPTYAPAHTHAIVCGDMNSITATDKSNLESDAAIYNYVLGNGGSIGWFVTNMASTYMSIDNIIVSNNVIINSIEAYNDWYNRLYSDHVPVVADLTLCD